MKNALMLLLLMLAAATSASAQVDNSIDNVFSEKDRDGNEAFDVVEQMPSFPGGVNALMAYLSSSMKYPPEAEKKGLQGRVILSFIVETDGSISNVEIKKSIHPLLDAEAIRVVKAMPQWYPGKHKGQPVRVKYTLPLTFRLQ